MFAKNKISWQKIVAAGFIYVVIATIIRQIEVALTMNYYTDPQYFGVWSKLMMPKAGPPPAEFFLLSLSFTFITGVVLAVFYEFIKSLLPQDFWKKAIWFSKINIILTLVFSFLPLYLLINLPLQLLLIWFVTGSLTLVIYAAVLGRIMK